MRNICSVYIAFALAACAGAPLEPDSSTDDASPVSDAAVDSRAILEAGNDTVETSVDAQVIVPDAEASAGDSSVDADVSDAVSDASTDVSREATTADAFSACSLRGGINMDFSMSSDYYTSVPADSMVESRYLGSRSIAARIADVVGMAPSCAVFLVRITNNNSADCDNPPGPYTTCYVSVTRSMIEECGGRYMVRIPANSCTGLCVSRGAMATTARFNMYLPNTCTPVTTGTPPYNELIYPVMGGFQLHVDR